MFNLKEQAMKKSLEPLPKAALMQLLASYILLEKKGLQAWTDDEKVLNQVIEENSLSVVPKQDLIIEIINSLHRLGILKETCQKIKK